jgi:hypothetical protein
VSSRLEHPYILGAQGLTHKFAGSPAACDDSGVRRRRGALRRGLAVCLLGSSAMLLLHAAASAQGITGGCTATVNGRTLSQLTKDNPLVVSKGQRVNITGAVPPQFAVSNTTSSTSAKVITPWYLPDVSFGPYQGKGSRWGANVEVPSIAFTLGPGTYKVVGTATGTGGWRCDASAWVKIDGNPTAGAAGGAVLAAGGAAAVAGGRGRKPGGKGKPRPGRSARDRVRDRIENSLGRAIIELIREIEPEVRANFGADTAMVIAYILILILLVLGG